MTASENIALMRKGYEAFSRGDLDTVRELFDPDITWHQPGHSSIAGEFKGVDSVFDLFGKLFEKSAGTFRADPADILASDERVVVLQRTTASRNGNTLDMTHPIVWEIRDGKPYDVTVYFYDLGEHDKFWA
jgi:uncharacterized protein